MRKSYPGKHIISLWLCIMITMGSYISVFGKDQEKTAVIRLQMLEEDSKKYIIAKVNDWVNDSIGDRVQEIDIYFYVERTFSLLPIGNDYDFTDENGEAKIEFPSDLPGDANGNVVVIVKIEDADEYYDTEVRETINWGIPAYIDDKQSKRSLWAAGANAPLSLILLVNAMIAAVWGFIIFIIFKIYRLSKL